MQTETSIADLVRGALNDARDLVREEIALARAELREEVSRARSAAISFTAAAVVGLLALICLVTALARGISVAAGWDPWAGFAIVALVLLMMAGGLGYYAYSVVAGDRHMPNTVDSMKENLTWMRGHTS
jgi:hypothetical protein